MGDFNSSEDRPSADAEDSDETVRKDFEAIKDSKRLTDWIWFVGLHPSHRLTHLVQSWIDDHQSHRGFVRRWLKILTTILGSTAVAASIAVGIIEVTTFWNNRPEKEAGIESPENLAIANSTEKVIPEAPSLVETDDPTYLTDWNNFFSEQGFTFFQPEEFLVLGRADTTQGNTCYGKNSLPPRDLWPNIVPTIRALEALRQKIGSPISIINVYRNPEYNACIGGSKNSQHTLFQAVDFVVVDSDTKPLDWALSLAELRSEGVFTGGIGLYNTFVHVDTRSVNSTWPRSLRNELDAMN